MPTTHRFRMLRHDGQAITEIEQIIRIEWVRVLNDAGWFSAILPGDFREDFLQVDNLIEFWRSPEGGEEALTMVGFLRKWEWFEDVDGDELLRIAGPDQVELLNRAPIGYVAGSAEASKTEPLDDMIKSIVDEAKGPGAGTNPEGRFRGYPAANFTISGDVSAAPTVERSFQWRQVLPVLQELAETSRDRGTPLFFDVVPADPAQFDVRTYIGTRGNDLSVTAGIKPIIFSKERGNLSSPSLIEDWTEEYNYVWGGGQGEGAARLIDTENDLSRILRSIWNRREVFQDAREEPTALGVASKAFERMQASRPRLIFKGDLLDSPAARYGVDWNFGDKVTAQYKGQNFDGDVRIVQFQINRDGIEEIKASLEVTLAAG